MRKPLIISALAVVAIAVCTIAANTRAPQFADPDGAVLRYAEMRAMHKTEQVVHSGELLGIVQIPRLGLAVPYVEGDDDAPLKLGAGHITHTAFPGHHGNAGIGAHRDTCFRALRFIKPNDDVVITTPAGSYDYVVTGTEVVSPDDNRVLQKTPAKTLTLVTCYPFFYLGHAPKRFIVHAVAYGSKQS